jgi:ABC-type glutathione transport system ATPase component
VAQNLCAARRHPFHAVRDVTLAVVNGEIFGLIGKQRRRQVHPAAPD